MSKLYLIANWKMNPTSIDEAKKLASGIARGVKKLKSKNTEVVICPPFPYLLLLTTHYSLLTSMGAQNCHFEDSGAYTGEVSPKMLKGLGVKYVIVGHSERRQYLGEDSELINKKIKAVLKNKMTPVLAVGESEREGESDSAWYTVVKNQLVEALEDINSAQIKKIIIAYEPVWAIGTGDAATPDDALTARLLIQRTLAQLYSRPIAQKVPILYGGSSNSKNIEGFIRQAEMDGALVGGASLDVEEFVAMLTVINHKL